MLHAIKAPDILGLAQRFIASRAEHRAVALAFLNGAIGDRLYEASSPLATTTRLFVGADFGDEPPPEPAARACLFVHGLMGGEHDWTFWAKGERAVDYPDTLATARGATAVYARYNTGRHISTNGRELADQLEALFARWPGLDEISVVAHSMGGLVTRSACHYALQAGHTWVHRLRRVFLLGVPVHGATLEQLAHVAAFTLEAIWNPWTKLVGKAINLRSAGIKDLRHGFVLDEDWMNRDPDQLRLAAPRRPDSVPGVRWFAIAGSLGKPDGALGKILGDGTVLRHSAQGRGFGTPSPGLLPDADLRVFDHTSHAALLCDPAVLEQILAWWA